MINFLQYGVKIFVLTSFKDNCCIEILPNIQTSKQGKLVALLVFVVGIDSWIYEVISYLYVKM